MRYLAVLAFVLLAISGTAQQQYFEKDHTHNVSILGKAKDSLYQQILTGYTTYLLENSTEVKAHLEKCRFIQEAYYDEYEDYNPNAEAAEACAQELVENFPNDPEVLIYANEFIYGDSSIAYLNQLIHKIENDTEAWRHYSWQVYELQARNYQFNDDNDTEVIRYARLATEQNDTLDISVLMATAYKNLNQKENAIDILINHLDSTDDAWVLNQKGRLLLELGASEKALDAFRLASRDSSGYEDLNSLAQAMIDNGLVQEARDFLLKDYKQTTWNQIKPLHRLLEYDLRYATPDSAALTYDRFVDDNFWNDAFGIYRLRLFFKHPLHALSLADLGRFALFILVLLLILIIPYLWILPIHYFGWWQKSRGKVFPPSSFHWSLKHFWIACSLWFLCEWIATLLINYPGILSWMNDSLAPDDIESISKPTADFLLLFSFGSLLYTLALLKREDVKQFFTSIKNNGRQILAGVGLALLLRFALGIYLQLLKVFNITIDTTATTSVIDSIVAINQFYNPYLGFIIVVLIVPFYEEVLFRGIFLSACERNMKFIFANILQASVFALLHDNLQLFPFYFAFGMVTGYYRQKTQGLLTGTSLHITNNLIAFIAISMLRRPV